MIANRVFSEKYWGRKKMEEDFQVIVSDSLLENMQIYTSVRNRNKEDVGLLILTGNMEPVSTRDENEPAIIKFYLLKKSGTEFYVESEIETFKFDNLEPASRFLEVLPTMSALELLLLKNDSDSGFAKDESMIYQ